MRQKLDNAERREKKRANNWVNAQRSRTVAQLLGPQLYLPLVPTKFSMAAHQPDLSHFLGLVSRSNVPAFPELGFGFHWWNAHRMASLHFRCNFGSCISVPGGAAQITLRTTVLQTLSISKGGSREERGVVEAPLVCDIGTPTNTRKATAR